jgi:lysozyme
LDIYEQLRRDEGVRLKPYTDTEGKLTIGIGHNLTDDGISEHVAELMFRQDFDEADVILRTRLPWFNALDIARQGVLQNMAFNLGFEELEKFPRLLMACAQGDWNAAADEMKNSLWYKEVGDRAVRLERQMRTGEWV